MSVIAFSRSIGPVPIDCLISEKHVSELEITANPIETGSEVADHAFLKPKQITLEVADANAADTYAALVRFQTKREPFTLVTGLSVYRNMLVQSIDATRDKDHSTILQATIICREVTIVSTGSAPTSGGLAPSGGPGGSGSRGASNPTSETVASGGTTEGPNGGSLTGTSDRAASTVQTGDNLTDAVEGNNQQSILSRVFG